jgi:phloretin hydrolase
VGGCVQGFAIGINVLKAVEGGIDFRSCYWPGYDLVDGKAVKALPEGVSLPGVLPRAFFEHLIREYSNLAALLLKFTHKKRITCNQEVNC